ncbi:kinetochore-associated protein NSL1 homolog isoform X1 [Bubalus bubalis]|uniref:kinetochore-associated protein NSL1 homolog isoform X1 n=1 Tax=Bubalus bubalis TaxID=89462 RepID=UPI001D1081F6|nr:kinetochore-associated protein NSL1 homolog isoform X1 [Bubalus bubalis]
MERALGSVPRSPSGDVGRVAGTEDRASVPATYRKDFRVRCTSKRAVTEMLELCSSFVQKLGDALPEEIREPALRDAQWTFESAVQENVSINGQAWQEASDDCFMDSDIKVLEDQFDEIIVDLATKRKQYPRKILEYVIKIIKAQQEILKQYHPVVHLLDLKYDPDPAPRLENLRCRGGAVAKEISEAMKVVVICVLHCIVLYGRSSTASLFQARSARGWLLCAM